MPGDDVPEMPVKKQKKEPKPIRVGNATAPAHLQGYALRLWIKEQDRIIMNKQIQERKRKARKIESAQRPARIARQQMQIETQNRLDFELRAMTAPMFGESSELLSLPVHKPRLY